MTDIIAILQDAGGLLIWPISIILLLLILVQGGAGDISSAFGGGGQLDSSLGVGAQQKISKVTGWFVAAFLVIVVILSIQLKGAIVAEEVVEDAAGAAATATEDTAAAVNPEDVAPAEGTEPAAEANANEAAAPAEGDANANAADVEPVEEAPAENNAEANGGGEAEIEVVE